MRPLIGVTTSEVRRSDKPTDHGEPPQREMTLGLTYLRAVELAGGIPVVLPPLAPDTIEPLRWQPGEWFQRAPRHDDARQGRLAVRCWTPATARPEPERRKDAKRNDPPVLCPATSQSAVTGWER